MEATDSGIHHFPALAKFFQGSLYRAFHSYWAHCFHPKVSRKERILLACRVMRPGYYAGHTRHLPPQLRSALSLEKTFPNVTSSQGRKQMRLYLFIFLLGSTLISFLQTRREGGTGLPLKLIGRSMSSIRPVRAGEINLSNEGLFMRPSNRRLFTCAVTARLRGALPDWTM